MCCDGILYGVFAGFVNDNGCVILLIFTVAIGGGDGVRVHIYIYNTKV